MVEDDEIAHTLTKLSDQTAADRLLELALENGGVDNVSFILGRVTGVSAP
jgi:serine/threonine protein phosphatase PrpC